MLVSAALVLVGSLAAAVWKYAGIGETDIIFQLMLGSAALLVGLLVVNEILRRWF